MCGSIQPVHTKREKERERDRHRERERDRVREREKERERESQRRGDIEEDNIEERESHLLSEKSKRITKKELMRQHCLFVAASTLPCGHVSSSHSKVQ